MLRRENLELGGNGGGRGIRTLDTVSRIHTFQACAFNRSATPPASRFDGRERGRTLADDGGTGIRTVYVGNQANVDGNKDTIITKIDAGSMPKAPNSWTSTADKTKVLNYLNSL